MQNASKNLILRILKLKNGFNTLSILTNNDEIKKAVPILAMEAPRGRRGVASTHSYLDTRWGEWSASRPSRALPPRIDPPPRTHWAGGWVGLRSGLDTEARRV
jgi:hypothetical protein